MVNANVEKLEEILEDYERLCLMEHTIKSLISMKEGVIKTLMVEIKNAWDDDQTFMHSILSEKLALLEMEVDVLKAVL
jgi:hypothetical protein